MVTSKFQPLSQILIGWLAPSIGTFGILATFVIPPSSEMAVLLILLSRKAQSLK